MEKERLRSRVSISILLLPIKPIKPSVYKKQVEIFEQFTSFSSQELINLPHHQTQSNQSNSNQIQFNFLNSFNCNPNPTLTSESNHLKTFEPHRHLIGVIGIIDCQEWSSSSSHQAQSQSLQDGYNSFKSQLETHYPRTLLAKCFGFNPIDSQVDNVNGLVIIPHIGDQSFYVNRLMADFASDLILRFRHLSSLLSTLSDLNNPHPSIHQSIFDLLPLIPPLASSFNQTTTSSPSRTHYSQKPIQSAPKARQPIAHLLTDLEIPLPPQTATPPASPRPQHNTHSLSLSSQSSKPTRSLSPNLKSQSLQKPHRAYSDSLSPSQPTNTPLSNPRPTSLLIDSRTRKKLSGRIKKLDADLCLMIGELDEALKLYTQAISISRTSNDLVWLASALEGSSLTKVMIHIHDHHHQVDSTNTPLDPELNTISLINEVIDSYEQALNIYSKPMKLDPTSSDHLPPIIYVQTGLRLLTIRGTLWKAYHESKPFHEALWSLFGFKSNGTGTTRLTVGKEDRNKDGNLSSLTRHSISELASRVYVPELVTLVPSDRIQSLTQLIYWYDQIDYQRKAAWMKRELIGVMLQNLNRHQLHQQAQNLTRLMNEIFKVYNLQIDQDLTKGTSLEEAEESGWLDIKIGFIKDGIILAERISDELSLLKLTLKLSKLLQCQIKNDELHQSENQSIIMEDSLKLMDQIPKLLNQVHINPSHSIWWGPEKMILAIELMSLSKKLEPIPKLLKKSKSTHNSNLKSSTFFYAPLQNSMKLGSLNSKLSTKIGTLVLDEPVTFLITLQNPLLFELEISNIRLSTTGVHVSSRHNSIRIGPSSIKTIKLICWPKEVGSLFVKGIWIELSSNVNSVSKEFLVPMVLGNQLKKKDDQYMECLVVDRLPVLKLIPCSKNLVERHLTIWDGEKVMIEFEIENQSKVKIGWKEIEVIDDRQLRIQKELKRSSLSKLFTTEDIYQLEFELFHRPSLIVQEEEEEKIRIEVIGKIGLGSAQVLVGYGSLDGCNWMRECREEIRFNVLKVLEVLEVLVWEDEDGMKFNEKEKGKRKCWIGIKVRNVLGNGKALEVGFDNVNDCVVGKQRVEAGSSVLIFTLIEKILLTESEVQVPIPSLDSNRQFILNSSVNQDDDEDHEEFENNKVGRNEAFWIREKLLESIQVLWNEVGGIRKGEIDLRSHLNYRAFDQKMINVLKCKEIEIEVLDLDLIKCIKLEEFVELKIRLTNSTQREMKIGFEIKVTNEEILLINGTQAQQQQQHHTKEDGKTMGVKSLKSQDRFEIGRSLIGIGLGRVECWIKVWENEKMINFLKFEIQVLL